MRPSVEPIVIVGSGAAGLSTAESLRSAGYQGELQIVGEEQGWPYDRPPLSKQILAGTWLPEKIALLPQRRIDALAAQFIFGVRATSLNTEQRVVLLSDGRRLPYQALVIATGVRPRELRHPDLGNVHVLRTLEHAQLLRASLLPSDQRLVVVGGGFLGLEVAASARKLGAQVTVVEPVPGDPLASRIGLVAAAKLVELHRASGVRVLTGVGVTALTGDAEAPSPYVESGGEPDRRQPVREVHLTDGTALPADVVLIAVGSDPCAEWLESSGLLIDDGVVCDEYCAAGPNVWAAGDVARWLHRGLDRHVRLEHRTNATEQGRHVAQNILGAKLPFQPVPFFWTDHFETKIQLAGTLPHAADAEIVEGDAASDSFIQTFSVDGALRGVLCWNSPRRMTAYRNALEDSLRNIAV
ncbi:MAG: hypothetical protein JWN95_3980 [Frankiales bacterium]|nr:hypothetical protein [Frankiales bacterium]